jgi:hypothetical protein
VIGTCRIRLLSRRSPHYLLRVLRSVLRLSIVWSFSERAASCLATLPLRADTSALASFSCVRRD